MSKKIILRKLGDDSDSYKNIFNGMYDKNSDKDNYNDDNPVCRLCLNYVIGRGHGSRYEDALCWIKHSKSEIPKKWNDNNDEQTQESILYYEKYFRNIPFCDKCGVKIHEEFDEAEDFYTKRVILACGTKFYIDAIDRGNY